MRTMPTKLHALLDYLIALFSILSPLIFGFGQGKSETFVPVSFGMLMILYNFFTDYELSMSREIPMHVHLRIDQLLALFMMGSPWLLGFEDVVYLPHLLLGLALLLSSAFAGNELSMVINAIRHRRWSRLFQIWE
ncbi:MAG TPA: hypothetical protein VD996_04520 [Chitinophagaceae bacterium]|nr:hypothetical protein [Chitinophagaceae bacterium]